jgi:hypothetical protein
MIITDIEEEVIDIEWFCVDARGEIARFVSGGRGFLPSSVKSSWENLRELGNFFRDSAPEIGDAVLSANRNSQLRWQSGEVIQAAKKGLYTFDCLVRPVRPSGYFAVVAPTIPIAIEALPDRVRQILLATRFSASFAEVDTIDQCDVT